MVEREVANNRHSTCHKFRATWTVPLVVTQRWCHLYIAHNERPSSAQRKLHTSDEYSKTKLHAGIENNKYASKLKQGIVQHVSKLLAVSYNDPVAFLFTIHSRINVLLIFVAFNISTSSASRLASLCEMTSMTNVRSGGKSLDARCFATTA